MQGLFEAPRSESYPGRWDEPDTAGEAHDGGRRGDDTTAFLALALADDTEPEPDLTVLRRRAVPYKEREAGAEDALLVIEVAETSLAYDRSTKLRLYAEAGIPEYWVVDCAAETVEMHRGPGPDGYRDVRLVAGAATLTLQAFPDVELRTSDIFA